MTDMVKQEEDIRKAMEIIKAIRNKEVSASMSTIEQFSKDTIERAKMRLYDKEN